MSTQTQAPTQSIPNQWAQSQLICFNEDQLSMSKITQALNIYQYKTTGHNPKPVSLKRGTIFGFYIED